jgi:hypothetical protein
MLSFIHSKALELLDFNNGIIIYYTDTGKHNTVFMIYKLTE